MLHKFSLQLSSIPISMEISKWLLCVWKAFLWLRFQSEIKSVWISVSNVKRCDIQSCVVCFRCFLFRRKLIWSRMHSKMAFSVAPYDMRSLCAIFKSKQAIDMQIIKVVVHTQESEWATDFLNEIYFIFSLTIRFSVSHCYCLDSWISYCVCRSYNIVRSMCMSNLKHGSNFTKWFPCDSPTWCFMCSPNNRRAADRNALHNFNVMRFGLLHGIMADLVARPFPVETINILKWICGWVLQIGTDADKPMHKFMDVVCNSQIKPNQALQSNCFIGSRDHIRTNKVHLIQPIEKLCAVFFYYCQTMPLLPLVNKNHWNWTNV